MPSLPTPEMIDQIRDIPIYRESVERNDFPILEKADIARNFPDNWMTPRLAAALSSGAAEYVLSTGTNHARMQIIRPPYFLLHSYYRLWSEHPDIAWTWERQCQRVSITTVLATEHVVRVHARKHGVGPVPSAALAGLDARRLDARTLYLNQTLDPALWTRADVERMLDEIALVQQAHPDGLYHLDCSSYYLAHLVSKVAAWGLEARFPRPASIIHAYELTPGNVKRYLLAAFDCPVIDLFGSTELGYLYYGDRHGRYLPYLDKMHLELVPLKPGSHVHSLIVSSVRNPYMPLIRYRSGDCVNTAEGSSDPARIVRFCGREKEMLPVPGGVVSHADVDDAICAASPSVFVYQLRVMDGARAYLRYTTFDGASASAAEEGALQARLVELTGRDCTIEHQAHLPIGKSGKYAWLVRDEGAVHVA